MTTPRRPTTRDLRRTNRMELFRALHAAGGTASRTELADTTGLSPATVSLLVNDLQRRGVLVSSGTQAPSGGRPREALRFDPAGGLLIGIDLAETYVHAQAFDLTLAPRAEWRYDGGGGTGAQLVDLCAQAVRAVLSQVTGPLLGLGISAPGIVDPRTGVVVRSPDGRLHELPLGARVAERLGLTGVHVDNPLRASVMAELWAGAGRQTPDLAVLTLGTGVGAGIAIDGVLRRGATQLAGEWGHVPVAGGERPCRCGRTGCLETYLGAPGIMTTAREHGVRLPRDQSRAIDAFARLHDAGDPAAVGAMNRVAEQLGDGLVLLRHLVDPALVVAGGWVAVALGDRLLRPAMAAAEQRLLTGPGGTWLQQSALRDTQVTLGAATLALADVVDSLGERR